MAIDPHKLIKDATAIIGEVLTAYCGATSDGTHSGVVPECVALMTHKFAHLSITEIREAFRLAAIGDIDVNLTAYNGVASVYVFGQVMSKYDDIRRPVASKLKMLSNNEEHIKEEENRIKKEAFSRQVLQWYNDNLESRGKDIKSYEDIPFYYYDTLADDGVLVADNDTKKLYLEKAIDVIKHKLEHGLSQTSKEERNDLRSINSMGISSVYNSLSKSSRNESIILAKKLYLFDLLKRNIQ